MDQLTAIIARAFDDGCGRSFTDVTSDHKTISRLARLSDATGRAEVLLELLGDELIATAVSVLPAGAAESAACWAEADADGQLELARSYAASVRAAVKRPPRPAPEDSGAKPSYHWVNASFAPFDVRQALPKAFGAWTADAHPNCLGMAICTAAFASLCGAPYMVVALLDDVQTEVWRHNARRYAAVIAELDHQGAPGDSTVGVMARARLERERASAAAIGNHIDDFHYAVVMRRADASWLLVDPYLRNVSVLSDAYTAGSAYNRFEKCGQTSPGLTISGNDGGELARFLDVSGVAVAEGLEHSRALRGLCVELALDSVSLVRLGDNALGARLPTHYFGEYPYYSLMDRITETDAFDWCVRMARPDLAVPYDADMILADQYRQDRDRGKIFTSPRIEGIMAAGKLADYAFVIARNDWEAFEYEVELDRALCRRLAEVALSTALGACLDRAAEAERRFPHPALEFMRPGFGLALAVVNQLRCWTDNDLDGKVMTELSPSQLYWHDAVDLSGDVPPTDPELLRLEATVRTLPDLHPAVSNKLAYLDRLRSKGN